MEAPVVELQSCPLVASDKAPKLAWSTTDVTVPESVYFDAASQALYVSNQGKGENGERDGWISKHSLGGKTLVKKWDKPASPETALQDPRGIRVRSGVLWVSDNNRVVGIQIKGGKHTVNHPIEGAKFLNDVNFFDGAVVVSDMMTDKIHQVRKSPVNGEILAQGAMLEGPNGLAVNGDKLVMVSWGRALNPKDFSTKAPGHVFDIDAKTQAVRSWTAKPIGHLDGVEFDGANAVIVTDWMAGKVMRVTRAGDCVTLIEGLKGSADIGFIPATRTLLVPEMTASAIKAYKLPKY